MKVERINQSEVVVDDVLYFAVENNHGECFDCVAEHDKELCSVLKKRCSNMSRDDSKIVHWLKA